MPIIGGSIVPVSDNQKVRQTLLLRDSKKLTGNEPANAKTVIGNVLDKKLLKDAAAGQDIVYANLIGEDLDKKAQAVVAAMQAAGVKRLVFVLSLGIYDEIPGKFGGWNHAIIGEPLKYYRRAADAIEMSGLDYTRGVLMRALVSAGFALGLASSSHILVSREPGVVARQLTPSVPPLTTHLLRPEGELPACRRSHKARSGSCCRIGQGRTQPEARSKGDCRAFTY
ncbi:MAG: NAD(P)H-binding protein [Zoogloea sp.]|nr:NAD(P)H-binding protein [Zoogloea sp.]